MRWRPKTDAGEGAKRVLLVSAAVALTALLFPQWNVGGTAFASEPSGRPGVTVAVGDRVHVAGARLGCVVTRVRGEPAIECMRAGRLGGTYGTLISQTRVVVVRFQRGSVGNVVFSAKHKRTPDRLCR
jgi:hypothetical protein